MKDNTAKLTTLIENAGLQGQKGYVYSYLMERIHKFSLLNNSCMSDPNMPTTTFDSPQERFKISIKFYTLVLEDLAKKLQSEDGGCKEIQKGVCKRIAEMEEELKTL